MNDAEFQKLLNAAPPLVLYASKKKGILLVLGAALFGAGCIALIHDSNQAKDNIALIYDRNQAEGIIIGWIGILFFGAGLLLGLGTLLLPQSMAVTLDHQGFSVNVLWKKTQYAWKDVSEFVAKVGISPEVVKQIDLARNVESILDRTPPPLPLTGTMPRARNIYFDDGSTDKKSAYRRTLVGYNCAIRGIYGLSANQMAQLMNHWRERALKPETASPETNPPAPAQADPPTNNPPHPKAPEGW